MADRPSSDTAPSVLLFDSADISRRGLERSLFPYGIAVEGTAASASEAHEWLTRSHVGIVLVDVDLFPTPSAFDLIRRAREQRKIPIAFDSLARTGNALAAIRAGAAGYLTKDQSAQAWAHTIVAVRRGEAALSRSMTAALLDAWRSSTAANPVSTAPLTKREWEVIARIAQGKTNRDIAAELFITTETARNHVSRILAKLELPNRAAAASRYTQLVTPRAS